MLRAIDNSLLIVRLKIHFIIALFQNFTNQKNNSPFLVTYSPHLLTLFNSIFIKKLLDQIIRRTSLSSIVNLFFNFSRVFLEFASMPKRILQNLNQGKTSKTSNQGKRK